MVPRRSHRQYRPTQPKARQFIDKSYRVIQDVRSIDIVGLDGTHITQESHILSNPGKLAWFRVAIAIQGDGVYDLNDFSLIKIRID